VTDVIARVARWLWGVFLCAFALALLVIAVLSVMGELRLSPVMVIDSIVLACGAISVGWWRIRTGVAARADASADSRS
jgi:hypothetical protein